ncbi:hypothetical protein CYLTODRAFT_189752 [Cylindrobasidium torrendii FP15055 ss-10]|uniref:Uncharacterized protein n=1 Tax=Cylindrobasidium torrendii FP15055 ss-10 TaxID=1314674 RepID=A0A0D7BT84_9AGAR|nr:hypothetical protein CYLTODRAFT_189752 [Cylindrobasidium torrendii FP15055 ss-10]
MGGASDQSEVFTFSLPSLISGTPAHSYDYETFHFRTIVPFSLGDSISQARRKLDGAHPCTQVRPRETGVHEAAASIAATEHPYCTCVECSTLLQQNPEHHAQL